MKSPNGILPDTNALIAYFANEDPFASIIERSISDKTLVLSIICVAEFLVKATTEEQKILENIMSKLGVIVIDQPVMKQAVLYRKQALQKSKRVYLLDCFIAATAKVYGVSILTQDKTDYPFSDLIVIEPKR